MKGAPCPIEIFDTRAAACAAVADDVEPVVKAGGKLGLVAGPSLRPLYREWVRRYREEGLSFRGVTSFNLTEYEGLGRGVAQSAGRFMEHELISRLPWGHTLIPPGLFTDAEREVEWYERQIRNSSGIDWLVVEIGAAGSLGFNGPDTPRETRTRRVRLAPEIREEAAADFGGVEKVPTHGMTMGLATILEAKRIVLVGWGTPKASLVKQALFGPVTEAFPASLLQEHPNLLAVLAEIEGTWP